VYLAIIALWAVFLIPWLGRHRDEHNGRRTADRYHRAMDTLARGSRVRREADGHAEQDSEYSDDDVELLDSQAVEDDLATGPSMPDPLAAVGLVLGTLRGRERGGLAARRRRRVLLVLIAGFVGSLGASLAGVLPGATPALFVVLMVAYLTVLFRQASRGDAPGLATSGQAEADRYRQAAHRAHQQAQGLLVQSEDAGQEQSRGWDARPTTLPTYVSKPKASKVPRVVDLTAPGRRWTGEAMVQRVQEDRRRTEAAQAEAQAQFEREMAVLERDPIEEVSELANPDVRRAAPRQVYRRAANG